MRFSWNGYGWQLINCLFTSFYALYLRSVMDKVGPSTLIHTGRGHRPFHSSAQSAEEARRLPSLLKLLPCDSGLASAARKLPMHGCITHTLLGLVCACPRARAHTHSPLFLRSPAGGRAHDK